MRYEVLSPVEADRRYEVGETIPAGVLPVRHADQLIDVGALAPARDDPDDRSVRLQSALADAPDDARTQTGVPNLSWLRKQPGLSDVTTAERDREWRLLTAA